MPGTQDYHVNSEFRIGGGESTGNVAGPNPSSVAPATARMMGRAHQHSQRQQVQMQLQQQQVQQQQQMLQQHQKQQQQQIPSPLMPPVELTEANRGRVVKGRQQQQHHHYQQPSYSDKSSRSYVMDPKQFHRKALGDWDFLETIGAGSMGKVKIAKHHYTNEICAIKIVNRATKAFLHKEQQLQPPQTEQEVLERQKKLEKEISRDKRTIREASLGQILYHPHICRLFEMCTMSNHFYMLFEYVSGGQLLDYIIQHGSLREHHARKFARGIASALQYLHANNIVHRDLKIENIMISTSGEIKIIDFGLSNMFDTRRQLHTFCGSLYFAAPELLKASPYIGPEVDIWSFGVVLYVLVCGKVPFDDENSNVLHEKIKQGKVDYPQHLSIEVISLLSKMLVVDPTKRASLKQVVEHHWMIRGYDFPSPSYVPNRIPMTPEMLDAAVVREMFRLEFVDDVDEAMRFLNSIVTEKEYQTLSRQYWDRLSNLNGRSITANKELNGMKSIEVTEANTSGILPDKCLLSDKIHSPSYAGVSFEDPTKGYNPLLSVYYLVDEMLRRKLAKLQRRQQQREQQQREQQQREQQQQAIIQQKKLHQASEVEHHQPGLSPDKSPIDNRRGSNRSTLPPPLVPPIIVPKPANNSTTNSIQGQRPLQVLVPPKLAMPEQAHTSPTTRKGSDVNNDADYVLSPVPVSNDYRQRGASPASPDAQERPTFGGLFRKLSQRRGVAPQEEQQHEFQQRTPLRTSPDGSKRPAKMHSRAVSEGVSAMRGGPAPDSPIKAPAKSASQKKNSVLPALPVNAGTLLQQQRERELEHGMGSLTVDASMVRSLAATQQQEASSKEKTGTAANSSPADESVPLQPLNVAKNRKLHPSARAKSVGHARRESLKFVRPAVPANTPNVNDTGFLEFNKESKNSGRGEGVDGASPVKSNVGAGQNAAVEGGNDGEASDEAVLDEASKAPPGSMPSIDYPRSLFLKGFFSVQTTSSKPLPIVRYKIINVLKRMHIDFREVKGGFVCLQTFPRSGEISVNQSFPTRREESAKIQQPPRQGSQQIPSNQHLQLPTFAENTHRRQFSATRGASVKRQDSVRRVQANIPSTPLASSQHERSASMITSPAPNNVSGELSSASLESVNQDDILTTSRAHDMNKSEKEEEGTTGAKERPPVQFEIHIVKVRIVGLAGVHFKKVSGNTWLYKELATDILDRLNL